jgi:formiminotetrahydrofolate cyclodeaminase
MLKDLTLEQFTEAVASEEAVPGGGSVAALAGALAAALAAMVARLTLKKEKFAQAAPQMNALMGKARQLQTRLMAAADQDADSYSQVLTAFRLPKATEDQKKTRAQAIQTAFQQAARVPLDTADLALQVMGLCGQAVRRGNPDMITDAGVGVLLARSAALGALMNVRFNLSSIKDQAFVARISKSIDRLREDVLKSEQAVLSALPL